MFKILQNLDIQPMDLVLVNVDFNVPGDEKGYVTDNFRIRKSLDTINYLREKGARIILMSHRGRPEGQKSEKLSLLHVAEELENILGNGVSINFVPDFMEPNVLESSAKFLQEGEIALLENTRFYPYEEANDIQYANDIVNRLGIKFYIQDAFANLHHAYASIVSIPNLVPCGAGLLVQKEILELGNASTNSGRLTVVVGGAKVKEKMGVVTNFLAKKATILTGGVVANTMLTAAGIDVGASVVDQEEINNAKAILDSDIEGDLNEGEIILPGDFVVSKDIDSKESNTTEQPEYDDIVLDLGPASIREYVNLINQSDVIIWAGTVGLVENELFSEGSRDILNAMIARASKGAKTFIGGGDTTDFVLHNLNLEEQRLITHISTGGSASLELLSGKILPGIEVLWEK